MHRYFAVIPARKGSKGIKNKNIQSFRGKPLLTHSLTHASQMQTLSGFCLWTDSPEYYSIANTHAPTGKDFGLRSKFCCDQSEDWQFLEDLYQAMRKVKYKIDAFVLLRPTTPERSVEELDRIVGLFDMHWDSYDSMRTVSVADKTPFKMWFGKKSDNGTITGDPLSIRLTKIKNAHSMPRQSLPEVFIQNGVMDIIKLDIVTNMRSSSGDRVMLVPTQGKMVDIDSEKDFL